jgi:hypothetical protein
LADYSGAFRLLFLRLLSAQTLTMCDGCGVISVNADQYGVSVNTIANAQDWPDAEKDSLLRCAVPNKEFSY